MKKFLLAIIILLLNTHLYITASSVYIACNEIVMIDSVEFYRYRRESLQYFNTIRTTSSIDSVIEIATKNKTLYFESDFSDEYFTQYSYLGEYSDMVLVLEEDYNTEKYFLINRLTSKIDTLVAKPNFYDDKILCIENEGTDCNHKYIEVWKQNTNGLSLLSRLDIQQCGVFVIDDFYLNGNFVFLKTANNIFLKYNFLNPR